MADDPSINPENWLEEHGDTLYRYALIRLRSETLAEDLVQETLLAGLQSFPDYRGKAPVGTWLVGILKHKLIDYFRKKVHEALPDSHESDAKIDDLFDETGHWRKAIKAWETPDQLLSDDQFQAILNRCLEWMPRRLADILLVCAFSELSTDERCRLLQLQTANQLWVYLSRARMKLRQCLDVHWFNQ